MSEPFLLLSCCAPCSCAVIAKLAEAGENFAVVFYNPNIRPQEEYLKRMEETAEYAGFTMSNLLSWNMTTIVGVCSPAAWKTNPNAASVAAFAFICVSKGSWNLQKQRL